MRQAATAGLVNDRPTRIAGAGDGRSLLSKIAVFLAVFSLVVGGWPAIRHFLGQRAAQAPLPDAGGEEGACAIWFIGSSTIHKWTTLEQDMRPWIAHNRGVSGASIAQIVQQFGNDPATAAPQAIVFYGGDNDIAHGESPRDTLHDLARFLTLKRDRFGDVPVFIVAVKPSKDRWVDLADQTLFNAAARYMADRRPELHYIDIVPAMLIDGRPGPFYIQDGIHLNAAGYRIWTKATLAALHKNMPRSARLCAEHAS